MIDTNAYSAFKQAEPKAIEIIRRVETLALCPTVLGELLGGFEAGGKAVRNRRELSRFIDSPRVHLLQITAETANYYARIYATLRQQGTPIPTNDMWI
ncbi:MAG: type II toxin-antitoxin system VapC family toxin, partial [Oceanicoccus sp.]|uniref:type II toxin-antitoxin system VapC family toxin n=1 Tax=Oceanicoccus sp. TaxID=2691044 RepID=UPI0026336D10